MGKHGKPVQLMSKHLTNEEKKYRLEQEKKLRVSTKFTEHIEVRNNTIAHTEFLKLRKLYKEIESVNGLDENAINEYCLLIADRKESRIKIAQWKDDPNPPYVLIQKYESYVLRLNANILKLENVLYLNPVSRMKAIVKEKKPELTENDKLFGDV